MKKDWTITKESFDKLLAWLDQDLEKAGHKYQKIRERLIKMFISRGFSDAEDLTDEVFNRVISKIETLAPNYSGETSYYFYGVASKVMLEAKRRKESSLNEISVQAVVTEQPDNPKLDCLDKCLKKLPLDQHSLILKYYEVEKEAKASVRMALAERFNLNINSLRVQVCRIRMLLKECVEDCSIRL